MVDRTAVLDYLERFAPLDLAESWDNVGLLLGSRSGAVTKVMTCLTVTPTTAAEAIETGAELIVSHHPILFRSVHRLTSESTEGTMLLDLVRAGIAVYSPHTAFDNTAGGINDLLCQLLQLERIRPLRSSEAEQECKIVVFVPESDLEPVSNALFQAGAGRIGDYSECSFRVSGTGTFFGSEATQPTVGQPGRREQVAEWRLEVICPQNRIAAAVAALRQAHSYEEPAFDVYPLLSPPGRVGMGRVGTLPAAVRLRDLTAQVASVLKTDAVDVVGELDRPVLQVAIACGAGGEFLADCLREKVDVFLTGEMRFHDQLAAEAAGLNVILPGHYATERCGVEDLARRLRQEFPQLRVWASDRERDPRHRL